MPPKGSTSKSEAKLNARPSTIKAIKTKAGGVEEAKAEGSSKLTSHERILFEVCLKAPAKVRPVRPGEIAPANEPGQGLTNDEVEAALPGAGAEERLNAINSLTSRVRLRELTIVVQAVGLRPGQPLQGMLELKKHGPELTYHAVDKNRQKM